MEYFKAKEIKSFVMLCVPLTIAFLGQKAMQFIDTVMMGWIGPEALAAGALGTSIFLTILIFCRGLLSAVGVSLVHARGSSQGQDIKVLLHQALYLSLMLSLPCMLLTWEAAHFLVMMHQDAVVIANTQLLLRGLTFGIPGFLLFYVLREFISAFGLARAIMVVSLISMPLTFVGNYVLIYGKLGFPALGVAGIGYAGALVGWFMFGSLLFYCRKQSILKEHLTFAMPRLDFIKLKQLFRIGSASGIIMVLDMLMFLLGALMLGYFGVITLAAYQIAMQCASIAYNLPMAVGIVTALEVGHAYGANDIHKIKRVIKLGLTLGLIISAPFALFFITMPEIIVRIFITNNIEAAQIYPVARLFLGIAALLLCFDALQTIIIGALRGLQDTFMPMLISVLCYLLIGVTCAYVLAFHTSLQAVGIWYGLTLGIFSLCMVMGVRLHFWLRKRI